MSINRKNVHEIPEIEVLLNSYLHLKIRVFTWGQTNDHGICKKYEKPAKHIILSYFMSNTISLK